MEKEKEGRNREARERENTRLEKRGISTWRVKQGKRGRQRLEKEEEKYLLE